MKVQKAKDPENLTTLEQMHLPWIWIPDFIKRGKKFEVDVKIGEVEHSMTDEHYVSCVELYVDGKLIERKELKIAGLPEVKFEVSLQKDAMLKIKAECNLHGMWEAERKVVIYRGNNNSKNE